MTGIDASEASIKVAAAHAAVDPAMAGQTAYRNITAEQAVTEGAPLGTTRLQLSCAGDTQRSDAMLSLRVK